MDQLTAQLAVVTKEKDELGVRLSMLQKDKLTGSKNTESGKQDASTKTEYDNIVRKVADLQAENRKLKEAMDANKAQFTAILREREGYIAALEL